MPNAAHDLAALFEAWKTVPDSKTIASLRAESGDLEEVQLRAIALYAEVKQSIDALEAQGEEVQDFRDWLPDWWKAVVVPDHNWYGGASSTRPTIGGRAIGTLRTLGRYLDKSGLGGVAVAPEAIASSKSALEEALKILKEDEVDLDAPTRDYVFTLITAVRDLLERKDHSVTVDLLRRINELRGALDDIADRIERADPTSEAPSRLRAAAARVMPTFVRAALTVGFMLDSAANVQALTAGS